MAAIINDYDSSEWGNVTSTIVNLIHAREDDDRSDIYKKHLKALICQVNEHDDPKLLFMLALDAMHTLVEWDGPSDTDDNRIEDNSDKKFKIDNDIRNSNPQTIFELQTPLVVIALLGTVLINIIYRNYNLTPISLALSRLTVQRISLFLQDLLQAFRSSIWPVNDSSITLLLCLSKEKLAIYSALQACITTWHYKEPALTSDVVHLTTAWLTYPMSLCLLSFPPLMTSSPSISQPSSELQLQWKHECSKSVEILTSIGSTVDALLSVTLLDENENMMTIHPSKTAHLTCVALILSVDDLPILPSSLHCLLSKAIHLLNDISLPLNIHDKAIFMIYRGLILAPEGFQLDQDLDVQKIIMSLAKFTSICPVPTLRLCAVHAIDKYLSFAYPESIIEQVNLILRLIKSCSETAVKFNTEAVNSMLIHLIKERMIQISYVHSFTDVLLSLLLFIYSPPQPLINAPMFGMIAEKAGVFLEALNLLYGLLLRDSSSRVQKVRNDEEEAIPAAPMPLGQIQDVFLHPLKRQADEVLDRIGSLSDLDAEERLYIQMSAMQLQSRISTVQTCIDRAQSSR